MLRLASMAAFSVLLGIAGGAVQAQGTTEQEGYAWAKRVGIVDPRRCGGSSPAFVEGCRSWANDQALKGSFATGGSGTGPDLFGNQSYSPPRSNSSSVTVFKRPRG